MDNEEENKHKRKSPYKDSLFNYAGNSESKRVRKLSSKLKDYYVISVDEIKLENDPVSFKAPMNLQMLKNGLML